MSMIPDNLICPKCDGYMINWPTTLSSRCKCGDKKPPELIEQCSLGDGWNRIAA